ncbi:hypothetical protein ACJJTC_002644 [Scirpophaga incertulas]
MTLLEKEWFIEVPWGRICVVAWGECSDPPVLLCHGSVDTAVCFRPLVKLLPKNFYYVSIELPGNGKSDHYPAGMMISAYDLVYAMAAVVRHFRWQTFDYMAHSYGTLIGFLYNISYPGAMTKIVNFDPVPMGMTVSPKEFGTWYHRHFTKYYENFDAYNTPKENGPRYTWQEALNKLMENRGLSEKNAAATLERVSEPVGDGLVRYTFDQRMKLVNRPPFSPDQLVKLVTSVRTPTLSIIARDTLDKGDYGNLRHLLDQSQHPHGNYRAIVLEGGHDVHFENPERMAGFVGQFLLYGLKGFDSKAKL